jgi:hypothetical protein
MPYILYKTDGTKLTIVDDASLDLSTDLSFVGKNYSGYGQVVNENFLKLLENFSSTTAPESPIRGQLWYDKNNGRLNVSYDGKSFKGIASIFVQAGVPSSAALVRGDLWWDSDAFQLKAFDGSQFQVVGPFNPATGRATWIPGEEETGITAANSTPISKAVIDDEVIAVVSKQTFTVQNSALSNNFSTIKRGITLSGADALGRSDTTGTVLWGSAAHAIYANTATIALEAYALVSGGSPSLLSSSSTGVTSYYNTATTSTVAWTIAQRDVNGNIHTNSFIGIATSARYADLAERYAADAVYDTGTVLVIGGENEVTATDQRASTAVAGIVSKNPAYMMNSDAGNDETHPYIALKGRVPCKIAGSIKKGDLLVTSNRLGYACAKLPTDSSNAVIGKALEDFQGLFGVIEVLVV